MTHRGSEKEKPSSAKIHNRKITHYMHGSSKSIGFTSADIPKKRKGNLRS